MHKGMKREFQKIWKELRIEKATKAVKDQRHLDTKIYVISPQFIKRPERKDPNPSVQGGAGKV